MKLFEVFNDEVVAEDNVFVESVDQPTEEKVVVTMLFIDGIAYVDDFPRYDEYNGYYDVDFYEKPVVFLSLGIFLLQQSDENTQQFKENNQPTYYSYDDNEEYEEKGESTQNYSFPLCFSSFDFPNKNFKIVIEIEECGMMQSHIESMGKIDNEFQWSRLVFHDPVANYIESLHSQNLQLLANYEYGNEDDKDLVLEPTLFYFPTGVSLKKSYEYF